MSNDLSALDTALALLARDFWPVGIYPAGVSRGGSVTTGKEPFGKGWGLARWLPDRWRDFFRRFPAGGVGICLGPGRGPGGKWLIDIEGDGPEAEDSRVRLFGGEVPETIGWPSVRGSHQLYGADGERLLRILARLKRYEVKRQNQPGVYHPPQLPGLELRCGGYKPDGTVKQLQSVVPPTPGTDDKPRVWNRVKTLADVPESFYGVLEAIADEAEAETEGKSKATTNGDGNAKAKPAGDRVEAWFRAALERAAGRVAMASVGNRHAEVLAQTRTLAGYLHYHEDYGVGFSEADLDAAMVKAADAAAPARAGDNPRCVRDAIANGKAEPINIRNRELHALATGKPSGNGDGHHDGDGKATANGDGPPEIFISTREHEVIDQAVEALAADPTVYQRGGVLVKITRDTTPARAILRPDGSPQIAPIPPPIVRKLLTKNAHWFKSQKQRGGDFEIVPAHPPGWAVSAVAAQGEWPGIRHIEAVVEAPVLRHDGTILDTPGYDPAYGLLYEPNGVFPAIVERPTLQDAMRAVALLFALVCDFPFRDQAHKAAWLAALLTPLARFAIAGPCPLFLFDANAPGTGKSLLADLIAIIVLCRAMARTAYPDDDDEMRKRISSIALAGDRLMLLDNIASTFGGSALDGALTGTTWRDRDLGRLRMTPELPLFTVWYGTGNNVPLRGDVIRRIIVSRLETTVERPEERNDFAIDEPLIRHARRRRPELLAAALTILRAYFAAGQPDQKLTPLGSFDEWSAVVRSAVVWATGLDPCATREGLIDSDPETQARTALVNGWAELPGSDKGVSVAEALRLLEKPEHKDRLATLRDCLMAMSRTDKLPSPCVVSKRLTAIRGRVVGSRTVLSTPLSGVQLWRVEEIANPRGVDGVGGVESCPSRENRAGSCKRDGDDSGVKNPRTGGNNPTNPTNPTARTNPWIIVVGGNGRKRGEL